MTTWKKAATLYKKRKALEVKREQDSRAALEKARKRAISDIDHFLGSPAGRDGRALLEASERTIVFKQADVEGSVEIAHGQITLIENRVLRSYLLESGSSRLRGSEALVNFCVHRGIVGAANILVLIKSNLDQIASDITMPGS